MSEAADGRAPRGTLIALWVAVMLLAGGLRFYDLERKPLHHDEGVNGFFLTNLVRDGNYRYDPENYHGPTLYYLAAGASKLVGLSTVALRGTTALAGLLTVGLVLFLRPWLGPWGSLGAAALLATSPSAVYFSRYFIHETLVVLFTLALVVATLRVPRAPGPAPMLLAGAAAGLLFATKETAGAHVVVLGIAAGIAWTLGAGISAVLDGGRWPTAAAGFAWCRSRWKPLLGAGGVFALVGVVLYSSLFTNPQGVPDAFRSLAVWSRTGTTAHVNPWYQHLRWLWSAEPALALAGGCGGALALARARHRSGVFFAFWSIGILSVYSLVPYKTPWLGLNGVLPLALLGGYALEALRNCVRPLSLAALPVTLPALLLVAAVWSNGTRAATLSLRDFDDEAHPYVYAHTRRGFLDLVEEIQQVAARSGHGRRLKVTVASPEHWPLAWYLRDYELVGYFGKIPETIDAVVVVGHTNQEAELTRTLGQTFHRLGKYPLRPGVDLVVFVHEAAVARRSHDR